jgi:hypothetical protein
VSVVHADRRPPGGPGPWGLGVEIRAVQEGRTEATFEVAPLADQGMAYVPFHYFPGWEVTLDGRDWPLGPGPDGLIAFRVPRGRHLARVRFGTTLPRAAGWALAAGALAALGALALRERRRRPAPSGGVSGPPPGL